MQKKRKKYSCCKGDYFESSDITLTLQNKVYIILLFVILLLFTKIYLNFCNVGIDKSIQNKNSF